MTAHPSKASTTFVIPAMMSRRIGPGRFGLLIEALGAHVRTARARRAAAGALAAMSDGELADMSITRCDVKRIFDPCYRDDDGVARRAERPASRAGARTRHSRHPM